MLHIWAISALSQPEALIFEVALLGFRGEALTQPPPVSKAPELEKFVALGPKGRHNNIMLYRHLRG